MCPPPCGPRRQGSHYLSGKYNRRTRTNAETDMLMCAETVQCLVKREDGSGYSIYRGRPINILNLIRDEYTHAKVARKGSKEYHERFLTYVITNDNQPGIYLVRV